MNTRESLCDEAWEPPNTPEFAERCEEVARYVYELLEKHKAILTGHFIGTSGKHLDRYVYKDAVLMHPKAVADLASLVKSLLEGARIDVVVAPAVGPITFGNEVAKQLGCLFLYTEKGLDSKTGMYGQVLKRNAHEVKGKRVLVVEDVVNSGLSLNQVIGAVANAGGTVVSATAIVNRSPDTVSSTTFNHVPFMPLLQLNLPSWKEGDVPEWLKEVPIDKTVGHGKAYLENRA